MMERNYRFFIFDANGDVFGSPNGYARHCHAQAICTRYRHKLWGIYDRRELCNSKSNLIYRIKPSTK